jgi:hypothetical protein
MLYTLDSFMTSINYNNDHSTNSSFNMNQTIIASCHKAIYKPTFLQYVQQAIYLGHRQPTNTNICVCFYETYITHQIVLIYTNLDNAYYHSLQSTNASVCSQCVCFYETYNTSCSLNLY